MATRQKSKSKQPPPKPPAGGRRGGAEPTRPADESVALHELAQERYLHYALSVITSRALPDVRDGLKPVQRRILYTMWQQGVDADSKHRKSATVVGAVMGSYHPHGDSAIYDALVRMAQSFSLRVPLVDGSGNFGSLDGDMAAAMRYTECRLTRAADQILEELKQDTVHFRPNYDGTKTEPVVLPARLPNLLVNGATGIAVGMATNMPPHNPEEVCAAALRLLDALVAGKELSSRELARTIKGPDFPTGGQIVSSAEEIKQAYETGQGSIKLRGTWQVSGESKNGRYVHITSIPYAVNKATLVERIAELVVNRKLPLLLDVRDVSTDDVRIELELKKDAEPDKVMAYLCKHTPLQVNFAINMTCLVPTENEDVGRPERLDLRSILWHFLDFRLKVVTRRLQHELGNLERRMHVLRGFAKVFDALDEILKMIRKSDGKADAAAKISKRFDLDAEQTDAILELKLYRLARLEILVIQEELEQKQKRAREIKKLLADGTHRGRWGIVREELTAVQASFGKAEKRRTVIAEEEAAEYAAEEFIIDEDNHVLVTRDGWIKRQKEIKDTASTRLREGDRVLACFAGSTKATLVLFSSFGTAYTARIADVPATTGYGEPVQKSFKLKDGEAIVAAYSLDPRVVGGDLSGDERHLPATYALAASSDGFALAFSLAGLVEPSTKSGRRFARLAEGARIVGVEVVHGDETLIAVSRMRRALLCDATEVNYLTGPGKGVTLIKLADDDELIALRAATSDRDTITAKTSLGGEQRVNTARFKAVARGGRGHEVMSRGQLVEIVHELPPAPAPFPEG